MDHFALGWPSEWASALDQQQYELKNLCRVVARHRQTAPALTAVGGERVNLYLPARLRHGYSEAPLDVVVGDWCVMGERFVDESNEAAAVIETVLPRRTFITRAAAGLTSDHQTLAANVDVMFVVTSVNRDLNVNRLRRYVLLAMQGGVELVFVFSKMDLFDACDVDSDDYAELSAALNDVEATFPEVRRIFASTVSGRGLGEIRSMLPAGKTAVFLGSSGVGKSTLVNALLDADVQKTGDIRGVDQRGRHTTSGSELFFVPDGGGMIIDTAGLRQVGLICDEETLDSLMPTVSELAESCRFIDCIHTSEPGCAVLEALQSGALSESDFETYRQLSRELAYNQRKTDQRLAVEERKRWKRVAMDNRRRAKNANSG